jgi:very-short-patch-repair endonuclease
MSGTSPSERVTGYLRGKLEGLYTHRLLRLLRESRSGAGREAVFEAVSNAAANGDIYLRDRKWTVVPPGFKANGGISGFTSQYPGAAVRGGLLKAIPCAVLSGNLPRASRETDTPHPENQPEGWDFFRRLSVHYRECLRLGRATSISHFADRHGQQFHLLDCRGRWWPDSAGARPIRIARSDLGGKFLEALSKRQSDPVLLGYPVSVAILPDGERIVTPVAILQCRWTIDDTAVTLEATSPTPCLNPQWVGKMRERREFRSTIRRLAELSESDGDTFSLAGRESWEDIPGLAETVSSFLPHRLAGKQDPAHLARSLNLDIQDNIQNSLGLFLVSDHPYTQGARADLDTLERLEDSELEKTSLSAFFGAQAANRNAATETVPVLSPFEISEDQFLAIGDGLTQPLTVISGPPGTGKSQVAAALMVSATAAGKSVLFSGHTHKSVDAVVSRMAALQLQRPLLVQASGDEASGAITFVDAVDALIPRLTDKYEIHEFDMLLGEIANIGNQSSELIGLSDDVTDKTDQLGRLWREKARREQAAESGQPAVEPPLVRQSLLARLLGWIGRLFSGRKILDKVHSKDALPSEPDFTHYTDAELDRRIAETVRKHREALKRRETFQKSNGDLPDKLDGLIDRSRKLLPILADRLDLGDEDELEQLTELLGNIGLARSREEKLNIWRGNAEVVLRHFPVWASTTLSVPGRIPCVPALFDYVIIDEATTSDIASALPLLARGKRCIIIGDRMQTGMVSDLDPGRERELLAQAGLDHPRTGRFSFSQISLFDLATSTPGARKHMLRDHFRCDPQIAGFVSETFYNNQLFIRTRQNALRTPSGARSGMHWTNIVGPIESAGKGSRSRAEAEAIAIEIAKLLHEQEYEGTIGVVTPFKKQAELIIREIEGRVSDAERLRCNLMVGTAHSFQGDDRDVILVSLCYGPGMARGSEWFIRNSQELLNVAVSRARAVCHIFGQREAAEKSSISHIRKLARWLSHSGQPDLTRPPEFESPWERKLHEALEAKGIKTITQYPLAGRRLDLAVVSPGIKLDIEVDGDTYHRDRDGFRKASDIWRDHVVRSLGWKVRRFWVYELRENMEKCVELVRKDIASG